MTEELAWKWYGRSMAIAVEGTIRYRVKRGKDERWRITMNSHPIGDKAGYLSFEAAGEYIDWGGAPNRTGFDAETGEAFE